MIGEKISPILVEIENVLFEHELYNGGKPEFDDNAFRAAIKIFSSALMDKMFNLQENEDISFNDRLNMANKVGEDIKTLVKTYTDIDTTKLYEK